MPQDGDVVPVLRIPKILFLLLHQLLKETSSGPHLSQDVSTACEL